MSCLWFTSLLVWIGFGNPRAALAEQPVIEQVTKDSILRVRGLVIVDENNTERVWIGAPAAQPLIMGKRINRGDDSFSGILLFDEQGTERSGYGTDSSGAVYLTLDEVGRQVATFIAQPIGGVRLTMNTNDDGKQKIVTLGSSPKGAYLKLTEQNNVIFQQPVKAENEQK